MNFALKFTGRCVVRPAAIMLIILTAMCVILSQGVAPAQPAGERLDPAGRPFKPVPPKPRLESGTRAALSAQLLAFALGDVFVSAGPGVVKVFDQDGNYKQTLNNLRDVPTTTGSAFGAGGSFHVTTFNDQRVSKFDHDGGLLDDTFMEGDTMSDCESIVRDAAGNYYVGQADGTRRILKYDGTTGAVIDSFVPDVERRGTDWIDLASDQKTIYYTSEGELIKRYDVSTHTQLPDFNPSNPGGNTMYALRILPDSGVIVANTANVLRYDKTGALARTYAVGAGTDILFALNLDPDGTSFWTAEITSGQVFKVDLVSGSILKSWNAHADSGNYVAGLAIFGERTAAEPLEALATITDVSCHGLSDGAIDLSVHGGSPPYSYSWHDGPHSEDRSGLPAGDYIVTVSDTKDSTVVATFTVDQPDELTVTAVTANASCTPGNDGSIDVSVSGGTGPYGYSWADLSCSPSCSPDRTGLPAGVYTLTVADLHNCTQTRTFTVGSCSSADRYRTSTYHEWAYDLARDSKGKLLAEKCTAHELEFNADLVCDASGIDNVRVTFGSPVDLNGHSLKVMEPAGCVVTALDRSFKQWNIALDPPIDQGVHVRIHGFAPTTKLQTVARVEWVSDGDAFPGTHFSIASTPGLPMPNLTNVGEAIYGGVRQTDVALLIGAVGDSKGAHSVFLPKFKDCQKTLVKITRSIPRFHLEPPRCIDMFDRNHRQILHWQKGLPPDKHSNILLAEALTLKLNILASDSGCFPTGLGELVFDRSGLGYPGPFDGMSVRDIAVRVDSFLSCTLLSPVPGADQCLTVVRLINTAFTDGTLDTISWGCGKPVLTGVRSLADVPYLHPGAGALPKHDVLPPFLTGYHEPTAYVLSQNYPNPFNPVTSIGFDLPVASLVTLAVYNSLGQEVASLISAEIMDEGVQQVEFDASALASGVYFYRLTAQQVSSTDEGDIQITGRPFVSTKEMVLMK